MLSKQRGSFGAAQTDRRKRRTPLHWIGVLPVHLLYGKPRGIKVRQIATALCT